MLEINKIYCGDCLEFMKQLDDKSVDLVLTDFPYGTDINYGLTYQDTQENLRILINFVMPEILRVSKVTLLTCGNHNIHLYPPVNWILAWVNNSGNGINRWGFNCWQPILAYGKDPCRSNDLIINNEISEKWNHPCPKPTNLWIDLLLRGSIKEDDLILDPFIGSGTTAIACIRTDRNFIGMEISPEYCEIANKRIEKEYENQKSCLFNPITYKEKPKENNKLF